MSVDKASTKKTNRGGLGIEGTYGTNGFGSNRTDLSMTVADAPSAPGSRAGVCAEGRQTPAPDDRKPPIMGESQG
jgi:hypothetical protein